MFKLKRIYEPPSKQDGWRVLVDRLWPRGIKKEAAHIDAWLKDIAPSDTLRKWFAHKPERWSEFQQRYRRELAKKAEALAQLRRLERELGTVTLLFGAKDAGHNQAVALASVLKRR